MNCNVSFKIDGLDELADLLEENKRIVDQLEKNMTAIEGVRLKISGKINRPSGATNEV